MFGDERACIRLTLKDRRFPSREKQMESTVYLVNDFCRDGGSDAVSDVMTSLIIQVNEIVVSCFF